MVSPIPASSSLVNFTLVNKVEESFVQPGAEDVEMMGLMIKADDEPVVIKQLKLQMVWMGVQLKWTADADIESTSFIKLPCPKLPLSCCPAWRSTFQDSQALLSGGGTLTKISPQQWEDGPTSMKLSTKISAVDFEIFGKVGVIVAGGFSRKSADVLMLPNDTFHLCPAVGPKF